MNMFYGRIVLVLVMSACAVSQAVAQDRTSQAVYGRRFMQQAATTQADAPWEKVAPEGGGFAALFPGKPTGNDQAIESKMGTLRHHIYSLETADSYFMVSYVDYPGPVTDPALIKTMLDAGREGGLAATHGELKSEKEIRIGENLGREWVVSIPGGGIAHARAYWVSRRLYQAVIMMPETKDVEAEKSREATMSKFLNSFVLTGENALR